MTKKDYYYAVLMALSDLRDIWLHYPVPVVLPNGVCKDLTELTEEDLLAIEMAAM